MLVLSGHHQKNVVAVVRLVLAQSNARVIPRLYIRPPKLKSSTINRGYADHVKPIAIDDLDNLPTHPDPLPDIKPKMLSRTTLHKLHRLSALNSPPNDSEEEKKLLHELGELVGLMELVKDVRLDGDVGELLAEGVGEVFIGEVDNSDHSNKPRRGDSAVQETSLGKDPDEKSGRELLDWASRRIGDFYAHKAEKPRQSS